jgi:hypothetical protein
MTHRRLRTLLSGRGFMLFPAAAFAVHQLRYQLAYGSRAGAALSASGHGYLTSLAPWIALLLALAAGSFLARVARAAAGRADLRPKRAFAALWGLSSAGLLAAYSIQETLEGLFAVGHPGGLEGVFGHGGWWAVPLSALAGLLVALLLRLAATVVATVSRTMPLPRFAPFSLPRPLAVALPRRGALAGNSSGRAPPAAVAVNARFLF